MKGQVIGKKMFHGYAGSYSRQPDMVVDTAPLTGASELPFGAPVVMGANGSAQVWGESSAASNFWGIAVREVKSAYDYMNQNKGVYRPGDAVPVMKRGCVNVICQAGTPVPGGKVYVRVKANATKPNAVIGGFEAAEDKSDSVTYTVELTNCRWKGAADVNGVAELRILTVLNA